MDKRRIAFLVGVHPDRGYKVFLFSSLFVLIWHQQLWFTYYLQIFSSLLLVLFMWAFPVALQWNSIFLFFITFFQVLTLLFIDQLQETCLKSDHPTQMCHVLHFWDNLHYQPKKHYSLEPIFYCLSFYFLFTYLCWRFVIFFITEVCPYLSY